MSHFGHESDSLLLTVVGKERVHSSSKIKIKTNLLYDYQQYYVCIILTEQHTPCFVKDYQSSGPND